MVILHRFDYVIMIYDIINDNTRFRGLLGDQTVKQEWNLYQFLLRLKKGELFSKDQYKKIYPTHSNMARMYDLPKTHKLKTKNGKLTLRPTISSVGSYN